MAECVVFLHTNQVPALESKGRCSECHGGRLQLVLLRECEVVVMVVVVAVLDKSLP